MAGKGLAGRVRFAGAQPSPTVRAWMQASDVFTLVSSLEGLPVSLIEAMSSGMACVVSEIPASLQLVRDGVTGVVTRLREPDALSHALTDLLNCPAKRTQLGVAARAFVVNDYSVETVAGRYEALFAEVCEGTAP